MWAHKSMGESSLPSGFEKERIEKKMGAGDLMYFYTSVPSTVKDSFGCNVATASISCYRHHFITRKERTSNAESLLVTS